MKREDMTTTYEQASEGRPNSRKLWALFFFWLIVIILLLIFPQTRPWFWLTLPMVVTYFAKAMDIM